MTLSEYHRCLFLFYSNFSKVGRAGFNPGFRHTANFKNGTCLTLSNIRYVSRVKWSNPGKGVAPSPTLRCSRY